jgi:hypothetical protein
MEVGEGAALDASDDGLTYAAVTDAAAGIEDEILAGGVQSGFSVHGDPATLVPLGVAPQLPGNADLVWEPSLGVVAFVGYSGASLSARAAAALQRIADRTRLLGEPAWQATHPGIVQAPLPTTGP